MAPIRRSNRIQNRCAIPQKSELIGEESSERNGKYPEADGGSSSTSPEPCNIQQLPQEVLAIIFSRLTPIESLWSPLKLRLVCKHWCDVYDDKPITDTKVHFTGCVPGVHLGNCGFRRLAIQFNGVHLGILPQSMWQKIGHRIHSIVLKYCHIGDKGLKNLISHCCNLKSLIVVFNSGKDNGDLFCSPKMLRQLHMTQKNLETFEIINRRTPIDVTKWIEIFKAFIEVFPNVIHYTAAYRDVFRFRFLKELDENDGNEIATSLAFSLSADGSHYRQALDAASALKLVDISLQFVKSYYENEDEAMLIKFFSNCNNLKFIEINVHHVLKTLFLQILQHCPNLRELGYYCRDSSNICGWFPYTSSETKFMQLRTMCPSLEKLSINDFNILINPTSLSYLVQYKPCPWLKLSLEGIAKTWPNLQHLDVQHSLCTDEMLQSIFKYLVNLRTLSVSVSYENTDAGITGRRSNVRSPNLCTSVSLLGDPISTLSTSGYSISHLKNLEQLILFGYCQSQLSDDIFYEFQFQRLRYLRVDRPGDAMKVLPIMGQNMPLLETIHFMADIEPYQSLRPIYKNPWTQSLVPFCQHMKKLFTIRLPHTTLRVHHPGRVQSMSLNDVLNIFRACPSLRFIEGDQRTCARYLPDTQEVILTELDGKIYNFSIK